MALVELGNGRTMDIPIEKYLEMNSSDYQQLIALGVGSEVNDPFQGSSLSDCRSQILEDEATELLKNFEAVPNELFIIEESDEIEDEDTEIDLPDTCFEE